MRGDLQKGPDKAGARREAYEGRSLPIATYSKTRALEVVWLALIQVSVTLIQLCSPRLKVTSLLVARSAASKGIGASMRCVACTMSLSISSTR